MQESPASTSPPPRSRRRSIPPGQGDAFRAGFLAALSWGLDLDRCAQVGNATAAHCLEVSGPQEYRLTKESLVERMARSYGEEAAAEVADHMS